MPTIKLTLNNSQPKGHGSQLHVKAYPLEWKDNPEDEVLWYLNFKGYDESLDNGIIMSGPCAGRDLCFKYNNKPYLIPYNDPLINDDPLISVYTEFLQGAPQIPYCWVTPSYRCRMKLSEQPLPEGVRELTPGKNYKPGWWLTGAPAMAGGMTLAPMASNALAGALPMHHLVSSVAILPVMAGLMTFPLTYAANWLHYKVANGNASLSPDVKKKIWDDSLVRSGQIFKGLALVEGIKAMLEPLLNSALENAWGGAIQIGGAACPAEIKAAVMLSVGLSIGLGMAIGLALYQGYRHYYHAESFSFSQIGMAFLTGCVAGAVSTIDFDNKGLSFLATWASLCLFPVIKCVTQEGRAEMKESVKETGKFFVYMGEKLTPECATLEAMGEGMRHTTGIYGGAGPGMPPY